MFQFGKPDMPAVVMSPDAVKRPQNYPKIEATKPQSYVNLIVTTGAANPLSETILPASTSTRVLLFIQNISDNPIWINFANAAGVNQGILLSPGDTANNIAGGSVFFDAVVSQDEVYAFSPVAGSRFTLGYANKDF